MFSNKPFDFFQELSGSYYLIPNIEKYLIKVLKAINSEFSLIASAVHYWPSKDKQITVTNISKEDLKLANGKISELSEIIIKENHNIINGKKTIIFDQSIEACIIPICFESEHIGLIILFNDIASSIENDNVIDFVGVYVSAAIIANYLITKSDKGLSNSVELAPLTEISIQKILEWRFQEIMESLLSFPITNQSLFHEIMRETEKILIKAALNQSSQNKSKAAKLLGLNRNTLRKKVKDLNIH